MREFFKPWRRKIGVVTLVMACVFAGIWVRANWYVDILRVCISSSSVNDFIAQPRGASWCVRTNWFPPGNIAVRERVAYECIFNQEYDPHDFFINSEDQIFPFSFFEPNDWTFNLLGIRHMRGEHRDIYGSNSYDFWMLHHFTMIVPITLLTAYLLLSKPRVAKLTKTIEPASAEVP